MRCDVMTMAGFPCPNDTDDALIEQALDDLLASDGMDVDMGLDVAVMEALSTQPSLQRLSLGGPEPAPVLVPASAPASAPAPGAWPLVCPCCSARLDWPPAPLPLPLPSGGDVSAGQAASANMTGHKRGRGTTTRVSHAASDRTDAASVQAECSSRASRERQAHIDIDMDVLRGLLHLNIDDAAHAVGLGPTRFKERLRELGVQRWPSRQLRSLQTLMATLPPCRTEDRERVQREIDAIVADPANLSRVTRETKSSLNALYKQRYDARHGKGSG